MKNRILLLLIIISTACSSVKVTHDYDKQIDFTQYKTYNYTEQTPLPDVGQLDRDRILKAIENEMTLKGFTKSDTPDVLMDIFIKTDQKVEATATTSGTGYGGYGRYGRYGYGTGYSTTQISYDEYTVGTMILSLIDNASQKIVWQGTGSKTLAENASSAKKDSNTNYAIQQILKNYPPVK